MIVILTSKLRQAPRSRGGWWCGFQLLTAGLCGLGLRAGAAQPETHWNLQSVTAVGTSAWAGTPPFTVVGVLLTEPAKMLDSTPNFQPVSASLMGGCAS